MRVTPTTFSPSEERDLCYYHAKSDFSHEKNPTLFIHRAKTKNIYKKKQNKEVRKRKKERGMHEGIDEPASLIPTLTDKRQL